MTAEALDSYFATLNGHRPGQLYDLVLREVEEPLFKAVLDYAAGNQSRAADILGIKRRHPDHTPPPAGHLYHFLYRSGIDAANGLAEADSAEHF